MTVVFLLIEISSSPCSRLYTTAAPDRGGRASDRPTGRLPPSALGFRVSTATYTWPPLPSLGITP